MKIMEALAKENVKILFGSRWLIQESGIFYVYLHKVKRTTDVNLYTGSDEETAVRFLIEGG